jgi:glycosyltransferase involved in cell wall biosynthesis
MKKILYIWKGSYPWDIRVEKVCKSLLKENYEVYLLSRWFDGQKERETINGINIIRAGFDLDSKYSVPLPYNPIWKKVIDNTIDEIQPDLVIPREIMLAEPSATSARKRDIPVIMDMAENYPAAMKDWKKYNKTFISKLLVHWLDFPERIEKKAVKLMDGIITVCDEQNARLINDFNYDYKKLQVVHNTPEKDLFKDYSKKDKTENFVFGHHGFTTAEKSLIKFVNGFLIALEHDNTLKLKIAGDGESNDDLRKIVQSSKFKDSVEFTGSYEYNEMSKLIGSFDIGVIPYQISNFNNNTIHNKIFDFFALGIPVLVSETLPFLRLINETKAGITCNCENEESIAKSIISMKDMDLHSFSFAGRKAFEEKYNWEVDSAKMMKFIESYL